MRLTCIVLLGCALSLSQFHASGLKAANDQEDSVKKEIESSLRQFFTAMSKRDLKSMREVLDARLVGLEASSKDAGTHWIDTADSKKLLPPEGNDDWDNVGLANVKIEISTTHPSVAAASFTLKMFEDRNAYNASMFAMLAHQRGKWKIICMSFPR